MTEPLAEQMDHFETVASEAADAARERDKLAEHRQSATGMQS